MHRRYNIAMLITSLALVIVAVTTMGISYAIWTSSGTQSGQTIDSDVAEPVTENNTWAKYFNYNVLSTAEDGKSGTIELTEFYHEDKENGSYGINLSDVYIPSQIWVKVYSDKSEERINSKEEKESLEKQLQSGITSASNTEGGSTEEGSGENTKTISTIRTYTVTSISNQVFKDATLKELAVKIYIPSTVTNIDAMAFANLPNLEYVEFMHTSGKTIAIADYAFVNCAKLSRLIINGGVTITATSNAFINCDKLLEKLTFNENGTVTINNQSSSTNN